MIVHTPAAWTAANLSFKTSITPDGTFTDLRDSAGALVAITGVIASGAFSVPLAVAPAHFVQIISQNAGVPVNQAAARVLQIELKS